VGVFSWTGLELSRAENYDPAIRHCIPVKVSGAVRFNLLAIWAMQANDRRLSYIAQVNLGLINYQAFIQETDTVLIGDLNSNPRSSEGNQRSQHVHRLGSHDWVVRSLSDLDLVSAYHYYFRQKHGQESAYTYFFARKLDRPYHLDYIFIPRRWLKRLKKVMVGKPETWLKNSDHCPVTVEIID
jgi:exodeoxyribonuclease-3